MPDLCTDGLFKIGTTIKWTPDGFEVVHKYIEEDLFVQTVLECLSSDSKKTE